MGKKLSTFIGDSTYTRAPPTYRSPLQSNNSYQMFYGFACLTACLKETYFYFMKIASHKIGEIPSISRCCDFNHFINVF
jgi:hypothetical protein